MKPSELRLNNRVLHRGTFEMYIVGIFEKSVYLNFKCNEGDIWEAEYSDISPIPLDAEWLERLQMPDGVFSGNQFFSVAPLTSNPKVYGLYFENEYTGMDFMYVHDLQNFSALTGTQLTTKKDSRRV